MDRELATGRSVGVGWIYVASEIPDVKRVILFDLKAPTLFIHMYVLP